MDKRKHMGKDKEGVIFPVAPNLSEMSDSYLEFINEIKEKIKFFIGSFRKWNFFSCQFDKCIILLIKLMKMIIAQFFFSGRNSFIANIGDL